MLKKCFINQNINRYSKKSKYITIKNDFKKTLEARI